MKHAIDKYINKRLDELKWPDKILVEKSGISKGQISKLKHGRIERLTGETYYKVYISLGDDCTKATKEVFGNIQLKKTIPQVRTLFGELMSQFEESKNTIAEISARTGIEETRLKELYFKNGSPEAYELLLIEKAIGVNQGELFEKLYGKVSS